MSQPAAVETSAVVGITEPKTQDTPKEEIKIEEPKETVDSKRFAEVSKREARILKKQKEAEASIAAREREIANRESRLKDLEDLPDLMKRNPKEAFKKLRTSYDEITNAYLADGKVTPELLKNDVDIKIQELEKKLEQQAKSFEQKEVEKADAERRRVLEGFSAKIVETIEASADKYPAVHQFKGAPIIYEMIQKRWEDTEGKHLMTIDEAAELLEKDLDTVITGVLQTPKYTARYTPQAKKEETKSNQSTSKPRTITNELTSTAPSMLPAKTENDRIKRALEKLA